MKVAVPVEDQDHKNTRFYSHFNSAPYFLVYDTENDVTEVLHNHALQHGQGDCNPVHVLADLNVTGVIVSGIGGRSIECLTHLGITVYQAVTGTISENIEALKRGKLAKYSVERSCGHHRRSGCGGH